MIPSTLYIDTLKIQVEFYNSIDQQIVTNDICSALQTSYPFLYRTDAISHYINTHNFYTAGRKILEITTGCYTVNKITIYYITIEVAGLKSYDDKMDSIYHNCLIRAVAYLNTNGLEFFYTGIDVAVDMSCSYEYVYAFCNKKAPRISYYKVDDHQPYLTTHYIERYNHTHNHVMKRAQYYDKTMKEKHLKYAVTRFELKLQTRFFSRNEYDYGMLDVELDRYHILCFPTLREKDVALTLYKANEKSIRRRDLHKLGLDKYRIVPDTGGVEYFLMELYNMYEHDLDLPEVVENNDLIF